MLYICCSFKMREGRGRKQWYLRPGNIVQLVRLCHGGHRSPVVFSRSVRIHDLYRTALSESTCLRIQLGAHAEH